MPSYYECYYDYEDYQELWCGMLAEHQRYHFDTFAAYDRAMTIFQKNKNVDYIILAGYYYKFTRELDGHISLYSHTPHFCEEVPFFAYLRLLQKARL